MKISALAAAVSACLLMSGCVVQKTLMPTGGSKADGTVELSFMMGGGEVPQIDWEQGRQAAVARCAAWGYQDAQAFGGYTQKCSYAGGWGCYEYIVSVQYQCTDGAATDLPVYVPPQVPQKKKSAQRHQYSRKGRAEAAAAGGT